METNKEINLQDQEQVEAVKKETIKTKSNQEQVAEKFSKYSNLTPEQLQRNQTFLAEAKEAVNTVLSNLPTAKFLELTFKKGPTNTIYHEFIDKVFSKPSPVLVGQGVEYVLDNGVPINTMDENKFIPDKRNDVDKYSFVSSITIPAIIKQVEIMSAPWKYINYFISGKVEEYCNLIIARAAESVRLQQDYDCFKLMKTIFANIYAKPSTSETTLTNHLVGTANYVLDAVKEMKDFFFGMYSHNKQFSYDNESFTGYNNLKVGNEVYVCESQTYHSMTKLAATFLDPQNFLTFSDVSKWVKLPQGSIYNPEDGLLNKLDIMVDGTGNRVPGAVLVLDKENLVRLINLDNAFTEFYPKNLTTVNWANVRYAQGILPWAQVAVYNNPALEQEFYIPTKTLTA